MFIYSYILCDVCLNLCCDARSLHGACVTVLTGSVTIPVCVVLSGYALIPVGAVAIVADPVSVLVSKCMGASADAGAAVPVIAVADIFNVAAVSIVMTVDTVVKSSAENSGAGSGNGACVSLRPVLPLFFLLLIFLPAVPCREDGCPAQCDQQE